MTAVFFYLINIDIQDIFRGGADLFEFFFYLVIAFCLLTLFDEFIHTIAVDDAFHQTCHTFTDLSVIIHHCAPVQHKADTGRSSRNKHGCDTNQ